MENIDHIIKSVDLKTISSKKTGKDYTGVNITLDNGYEKLIFLDFAEMFMVKELLKKQVK